MFIQIGDLYINQDRIESIIVRSEIIEIYLDTWHEGQPVGYTFDGDARQAILDWLEYTAEVSKVC